MSLRLMLILGCIAGGMLHATEPDSFRVRVAILRNEPDFKTAFRKVCQHDYKDTIRIVKNAQGAYDAINILDVEDFLLGVIGREMSPDSPREALKAQAVAARSHALYQASISGNQTYDLVANLSQAYLGKVRLHKNIILAIESTRGEVLYYKGKPIPTFFHSSCGGHTETAASVWQTIADPASSMELKLPSAVPCPYCARSNDLKWKFELSVPTLQRLLKQEGHPIGASPAISIAQTAKGGHALTISILGDSGEIKMPADKFRALVGYSNLRSTLFQVSRPSLPDGTLEDCFVFKGEGHGHGVGLCQYGARIMADQKASYSRILSYYFPQSSIRACGAEILASAHPTEDRPRS